MSTRALAVHVGSEAAERLAANGWDANLFSLLLGASGGPKWFILAQLDRFLFGDFLQRSQRPLSALGSSIGSWRHACLAQDDPVAAMDRMQEGYLYQHYQSARPSAEEISTVSKSILQSTLGPGGAAAIAGHTSITSHIVTARGRGPSGSQSTAALATGMGAAALGNMVSRKLLRHHFQRVVFHSGQRAAPDLALHDFQTAYCALQEQTVLPALHASGAIPFVLTGERDIPGAPPGQYWDGGIIDYHFDLSQFQGEGLILYPHFRDRVVPGWFDKFLPWRHRSVTQASRLVLLCPNDAFVAGLPQGKIPDRGDFSRFGEEERIRYWEDCIEASKAMAEEFAELISGPNPLAGVVIHD